MILNKLCLPLDIVLFQGGYVEGMTHDSLLSQGFGTLTLIM